MEEVIKDEDLVVVVVENDNSPLCNNAITPVIKGESADSEPVPIEEIFESAVKHGEYIAITSEKEKYEQLEFLDDAEISDDKDQTVKLNDRKSTESNNPKKKIRKKRIFAPKPNLEDHIPVSYVQELRDTHPEFVTYPEKLVDYLASIMNRLRPPKLPPDAYTVNNEEDTVVCNTCGHECESAVGAANHYQRYHGQRYLKCYACGLDYTNTANLYKHEKKCKSGDAEVVLKARGRYLGVKGRGRPYTTDNKFLVYTLPHMTAKKEKWTCSQCALSFSQRATLQAHENMHRNHRPYACHTCAAAYTSAHSLSRHLQSHEQHQYKCEHCAFATKHRSLIVSHLKMHMLDQKYRCESCSRRFLSMSALRRHGDIAHRDSPPHACHLCPKRYTKMYVLKRHLKKCHGLAVYTPKKFLQELPKFDSKVVKNAQLVLDNGDVTPHYADITVETEENGGIKIEISVKDEKEDSNLPIKSDENTQTKLEMNKKNKSDQSKTQSNSENKIEGDPEIEISEEEHKLLEVVVPKNDDPAATKKFLNFLHTKVKSGYKVKVRTRDKMKSVQLYKTDEQLNTLPRVKVVRNFVS